MLIRIPKKKNKARGKWDSRIQREMLSVMLENRHRFATFTKLANWIDVEYKMAPASRTLEEWYAHYKTHHELPYETAKFYESLKKRKSYKQTVVEFTKKWNKETVGVLRDLLNKHPDYYLDEFVEELFVRTGVLFHPSTVHYVFFKAWLFT